MDRVACGLESIGVKNSWTQHTHMGEECLITEYNLKSEVKSLRRIRLLLRPHGL